MRSNVMLRKSLLTRKLNNAPISVRHRTTAIFVSDFSDESADEIVEEKDVVQSGEQEEQLQEDVADEPPAVEDKLAQAIKEAEKKLQDQLSGLESTLRSERLMLSSLKDKVSESGKPGYFMIQAQVNEYVKRRDSEQKSRVASNKRDFVSKVLPIIDAFREVPIVTSSQTEREQNMHKNFGSLCTQILMAIEKFGFKEYSVAVKDVLDPVRHQVQGELIESGTEFEGKVVEFLRPGLADSDNEVVRRALVIGGKSAVSSPPESAEPAVA